MRRRLNIWLFPERSCDILLSQSSDGYYLYLYWIGGNTNYIRAEQWDCVDK